VDTIVLADLRQHAENAARPDAADRDATVLHPSEICKIDWCPAAALRQLRAGTRETEHVPFALKNIFEYGNDAHARYQRWLAEMGELEGLWRCLNCGHRHYGGVLEPGRRRQCPNCLGPHVVYDELPLANEPLMIAGHTDGYLPRRRALIEIKTIGEGTVRMEDPALLARHTLSTERGQVVDWKRLWDAIHRPFAGHLRQGQIYLHLAHEMGIGAERIAFLYENKLNQDLKEFQSSYDPSLIERVLAGAAQIAAAMHGEKLRIACRNPASCKHCQKTP
jgi:hypothetical protein